MNDLYDRIRPANEVLDEAAAARVRARVFREEPESDHRATRTTPSVITAVGTGPETRAPQHSRIAAWVAAAAVVVGVAGISASVGTRSETIAPANTSVSPGPIPTPENDPNPQPETDPVPVPESDTSVPDGPSAGSEASPDDLSTGNSFAVADVTPEGMTVGTIRAETAGSVFAETQWAQLGPDGSVTGVIAVRHPVLVSAEEAARSVSDFEGSVRGLPAAEWQDSPDDGASFQRTGIYWIENSLQLQVSATGTADDLVRPVAEALVLDVESRTAMVPDDFGLVAAADLDFADSAAVRTTIFMQPAWSDSQGVGVSTWPNTFGYELDQLIGTNQDWQPMEIDGTPALGLRTLDDDLVAVGWLDGDMLATVTTSLTLSDDEMLNVARGIRFTDANEFQMYGQGVADRANAEFGAWTVFDRAATEDGIEVSIRSEPGGTGANALCIDAPIVDCTLLQTEGGIVDDEESYGAAGFDLGDRTVGVGWISGDIDAATTGPSLHPIFSLDPNERLLDQTSATILLDATTGVGRFVVIDVPDGEPAPAIRFEADGQGGPSIDLVPTVSGPFEF